MKSGPFKPDRVGDGTGDVIAPATNTANFIPQWDGSNSKTLKDGKVAPSGTIVGTSDTQTLAAKAFSDRITSYNGFGKAANGIPWIVSVANYVERTTSIPQTNLRDAANQVLPFGYYRVSWYATVADQADAGVGLVEIVWDPGPSEQVSDIEFDLTDAAAGYNSSVIVIRTVGGSDVTFSVTLNGVTGSPNFFFFIIVECLALLDDDTSEPL